MDLDLSGKLALVTGSTRGIGLAAAKGLAGMGADVIVNGRERSAVFDAITQITRIAPKAKPGEILAQLDQRAPETRWVAAFFSA